MATEGVFAGLYSERETLLARMFRRESIAGRSVGPRYEFR